MMKRLLPLIGSINALVFRVPLVGELLVRGQSRLAGKIAFHLPIFGATKRLTLKGVQNEWLRFLGRAGIKPDSLYPGEDYFDFTIAKCPYGFKSPARIGVCDACMDLDRTYIKLLGGELTILEAIPQGASQCLCRVKLADTDS